FPVFDGSIKYSVHHLAFRVSTLYRQYVINGRKDTLPIAGGQPHFTHCIHIFGSERLFSSKTKYETPKPCIGNRTSCPHVFCQSSGYCTSSVRNRVCCQWCDVKCNYRRIYIIIIHDDSLQAKKDIQNT